MSSHPGGKVVEASAGSRRQDPGIPKGPLARLLNRVVEGRAGDRQPLLGAFEGRLELGVARQGGRKIRMLTERFGGLLGVLAQGFKRASFSSEAGVGSASIAHSAAQTPYPVREGIVALLEPFIDTVLVCTTTALVIVVTGTWDDPEAGEGIAMTATAFATVFPWFPKLLTVVAVLFAFSTMISWSYYGERCWVYLFGEKTSMVYKVMFLGFIVFGSVLKLGSVIDFSDLMILGMAFPNILGVVLLSGKVKTALDDYMKRLADGDFRQEPQEF